MNTELVRNCRKALNLRVLRKRKRRALGIGERKTPRRVLRKKGSRTCIVCKKTLPHTEVNFRLSRKTPTTFWFRPECRKCEVVLKRNSFKHFVASKYCGARKRTLGRDPYHRGAVGKSLMSRAEFVAMVDASGVVRKMWEAWKRAGFPKYLSPSMDRIDRTKGYEAGNIQWITWQEHVGKTREENKKGTRKW